MKKSVYLSLGAAALIVALLFTGAIALPQTALAWDSPCQLQPGINMTTADITVLPDGTVYGAFMYNNVTTVYKWNPPSCNVTPINAFTMTESGNGTNAPELDVDNGAPEVIHGPTQNARPDIESNSAGDVVVAYRTGSAYGDPFRIYYARKSAQSGQFGSPVLVAVNGYAGDIKLDSQNNVHIVYFRSSTPGVPGAFYQKFNANNISVVGPIQLTSFRDATPEMDLDSEENAHIVYVDDDSYNLRYVRISNTGVPGPEQTITTASDTFFPYIAVDSQNRTHFVWEGRTNNRQIWYKQCDSNGLGCSGDLNLSQGGAGSGFDGHIVTCGVIPFVSWYLDPGNPNKRVYVSKNLQPGVDVSGNLGGVSAFNVLAPGNNYMHVLYRGFGSKAFFTRQQEPGCVNTEPTATPTATPTHTKTRKPTRTPTVTQTPTITPTPTITQTPTDGPTPTPTDTPTMTSTPEGKIYVDDANPAIKYRGHWVAETNGPSCLYPGNPNTVHKATAPKRNRAIHVFNGTRVKLWYLTGPGMGTAQVLIDGLMVNPNLNMNSSNTRCDSWLTPLLPDGEHKIVIRPKPQTLGEISVDVLTIYP